MPTEEQAVKLLEELGITEYEARCFVALSRVPKATAKEVSELSDVPRSRVYDAVDRLHRRGLVDVQQSEPREYRSISKESAIEILRDDYESTLDAVDEALSDLRKSEELEDTGAWAIADQDHVSNRIATLVEDAESEIYVLVADDRMIDGKLCELLSVAADHDLTVLVEVSSEDARAAIADEAPAATVAVTDLAKDPAKTEEKWLGRMLMVDRRSVLLSAVTESALPGQLEETAIWASGHDHGLVVGINHLLGARIDDPDVFDSGQ
ncbi:TrmB family transcriptional regulator [Halostella sp. JP-L12]|uniref:TrmB family transcriptional regulator n=1 Tax=Halostella TaxID=1843185 RepID=UPI000EF8256E|nr:MULTISPECIES: helix-turn-helix domain-containing protein [Halostella]NHN47316.1 TrmB family transcriptional regulator [Halostella sp. JP-L12]